MKKIIPTIVLIILTVVVLYFVFFNFKKEIVSDINDGNGICGYFMLKGIEDSKGRGEYWTTKNPIYAKIKKTKISDSSSRIYGVWKKSESEKEYIEGTLTCKDEILMVLGGEDVAMLKLYFENKPEDYFLRGFKMNKITPLMINDTLAFDIELKNTSKYSNHINNPLFLTTEDRIIQKLEASPDYLSFLGMEEKIITLWTDITSLKQDKDGGRGSGISLYGSNMYVKNINENWSFEVDLKNIEEIANRENRKLPSFDSRIHRTRKNNKKIEKMDTKALLAGVWNSGRIKLTEEDYGNDWWIEVDILHFKQEDKLREFKIKQITDEKCVLVDTYTGMVEEWEKIQ